ncbi:dipeptidyl aminopeptidase/acylaminoacyl peptidase [Sphingomonas zeicaulis]|uniref:alpha/beta hydrolase family protein n=1 Tax=Sphingomonas zeicaulis TaxID=1632740 RepID=UPI003D202F3E
MRSIVFLASTLWAALPAIASAQPAAPAVAEAPVALTKPTAADLGALPFMNLPVLSPDGARMAARGHLAGRTAIVVSTFSATNTTSEALPMHADHQIEWYRWAGNGKLLVSISRLSQFNGEEVRMTRVAVVDIATRNTFIAGPKMQGIDGDDVIYVDPDGAYILLSTQATIYDYPSVHRIDLATGKSRQIVSQSQDVWRWFADASGVVRGGIGHSGGSWWVLYRSTADAPFKRTIQRKAGGGGTEVDRFEPATGQDSGYAVATSPAGRFSLYRYDFRTDALGELVYENPAVDIDDYDIDASGKLRAVYYTDEHGMVEWFDPALKSFQARLNKALPGSIVRIVSTNRDRTRYLVWAGGSDDPGRYFLFDKTTNVLAHAFTPFDRLADKLLAPMKPVRYKARDGLEIRGYLTLPPGRDPKNLPLIVMPHGGPFARDELGFDPWVQYLASKGYAVLQPNFRGSTGFGKAFVERGTGAWGRGMQDDIDDGAKWLATSGVADAKRVCIMGASFGGYAAMWAAARNPDIYRCAISFAGISDVGAMLRYDRKQFSAPRYFSDWRERVAGDKKFELGQISPLLAIDRMSMPILIAHGSKDSNVPMSQSRRLHDALTKAGKAHDYVIYEGEGHGFEKPENSVDFLERVGRFLDTHNPA